MMNPRSIFDGDIMTKKIVFLFGLLTLMSLLLLGCGTNYDAPQLTPTSPNPAEIALTMMANEMNAKATQQMIGIQFTATAQVIEATRNVESTQAAISITEQARRDAQATDQ